MLLQKRGVPTGYLEAQSLKRTRGFSDPNRRLEEQQDASQSYMDESISLMELAQRAADLFAEQTAIEKRRLLEFVLSNSFWVHGTLQVIVFQCRAQVFQCG